jgi:hypothetical protein
MTIGRETGTVIRHGVEHVDDCSCKVVHHFKCPHCKVRVGWCRGAYDNMPEACDMCWKPPASEAA